MNVQSSPAASVTSPQLTFRGGKVLENPQFVPIYLGQYWSTKVGKSDRAYFDKFCRDLPQSDYTSVWKQYGAGAGECVGSDIAKAPRRINVGEAQIQQIVQAEISSRRVPTTNGETVYTVFLPPGVVLASEDGYTSKEGLGGYHGSYTDAAGKKVYYAAVVYSRGDNGIDFNGNARDNVTITASHEWSEAVTDPDVNNGKLGWYSDKYGEISDIPLTMGMPLSQIYDRVDGFAVQKNWSNHDNTFESVARPERKT